MPNIQMPAHLTPEQQKNFQLASIFTPHGMRQRQELSDRQGLVGKPGEFMRFVHYTSAEAAKSILTTRRIWMRNTTCMADYKEVGHGFEILQHYFTEERTKTFSTAFEKIAPGVTLEAIQFFNGWWKANLGLNIFVSSISEHDRNEDVHGRLSMWRAFGNTPTKVALVIRIPYQSNATQALSIVFSPVAYMSEADVFASLDEVARLGAENLEFLKAQDRQMLVTWMFTMLFANLTCLKHEGFKEEKEWRAIHSPQVFPSQLMKPSIETIAGVPQHIYPLPLDERVSRELADLDLARILDRIIIGPSPYPWVLYNAFVEILNSIGVVGASEKVFVSGIPLRV